MAREPRPLEKAVGRILLGGVCASGFLVAAGLTRTLALGIDDRAARVWLLTGLFILIGTPIGRILFLAAGFAKSREWRFCAICLALLGLIGLGVLAG